MRRLLSPFFLTLLLFPLVISAEVLDSSTHGFVSKNTAVIPASPAEVYAKMIHGVSLWWSPDHTYSGDATNLRIEARQGGCFCETLPNGGSVRHLTVVNANPGNLLRFTGGLGPLQAEGMTGSLSWAFEEVAGGTNLTVTYAVGGYVAGGLDTWAGGVDRVVGEQLDRLARFVQAGDPEEPADDPGPAGGNGQ